MGTKKLSDEYLETAVKLYGRTAAATSGMMLLIIVAFLAAMNIGMAIFIYADVLHIATANGISTTTSILMPIFSLVIAFQAINIVVGMIYHSVNFQI
jgi:hypothetical protein